MNKIEYAIDENGIAKVVMSQNAAKEIRIAMDAFEMGQRYANGQCSKRQLAQYIKTRYCDENVDISNPYKIRIFVKVVKRKVNELLP